LSDCRSDAALHEPESTPMPSASEPSVEELREQSERNREALATTVGELRERVGDTADELKTLVSPSHMKQEFKDYMRGERESLVKSIRRKAAENPLQLAAMGAAVAYPAWGLLRAIPTPLLLIGAGLFLTSKKGQETAKDVKAKIQDVVQQGSERVSDVTTGVRSDLEDRIAGARYGAEELRDTMSATASSVVDSARARFHDTADRVKNAAGGVADATSTAVDRLSAAATKSTDGIKERAATTATTSRDAVVSFVNDNALLVAGIGAAVGAFIAASFPASDVENRMFGAGSEKLKSKAREAAAQGIEKAGDLAAEAAGSVAAAAAREGLDASGVRQALGSVADSVRAVADRGIDTALGSTSKPNQQPVTERNPS
jgi:gas vesicle protein